MFDYSNKLKLMRDMQNLQRIKNVELYAMRLLRAARWIKGRISRRLDIPVGCFVLLFALDCFAQRGTNLKEPVQTVGALALPVPVFRQTVLRWDNPLGASNVVSWGLARNAWTNGNRTINTNAFFVTNGWHYRVTAMVAGVESTPALWPSNAFYQKVVQTSTNLTLWKDAFVWTNNTTIPQEYLRLRSELTRWE